jgi:TolB-like protein/Flp pilus assembly protein TadD
LLTELKRRNVIRTAGLYLVGAWLIVQVAGTLLPVFEAPSWVMKTLVGLLALGLVPALVFAWVFELTPQGIKRDAEVKPEESIAPQTARRMDRTIFVVMALALAYFAFDRFVLAPRRDAALVTETKQSATVAAQAKSSVDAKSIAVLPFVNMSSDAEQEYFSDGMTEEILNALAKVPGLAVTARTSVFSLKGAKKDVREIGALLGVAYVLEGSVRRAGDEVRITAQLIRADNGFHLWSETYDRKLEHVFALQAELAGAIAKELALPLGVGGNAALVTQRMDDPEAYALYLQARAAYRARGDGVKRSIELYREVLKRDPKYAPAWSGLCGSLGVLSWYVSDDEKKNTARYLNEAVEAGERALALAPDSIDTHIMLAKVYTHQWRWALADQHFRRALALEPNDAELLFNRASWLAAMGRTDEALQSAQRAKAIDPLVPVFLNTPGFLLYYANRNDESIAVLEAAHALAPDFSLVAANLARGYLRAGRADDAERVLDSMKIPPPETAVNRAAIRLLRDPSLRETIRKESGEEVLGLALAILKQVDVDLLFIAIDKRMDMHDAGTDPVVLLRSDALADHRHDPRYIALLRKAGFDEAGVPLPAEATR